MNQQIIKIKFILKGNCYKMNKFPRNYQELEEIAKNAFQSRIPEGFCFKYEDSDKDSINIESQIDFEAFQEYYYME